MMMTAEQTMSSSPDLEELDKTLATLNSWLATTPATDSELRLKITDRILKAIDMRRKMAPPKGKGGKFGKMSGGK